jgi:enoyl-CoA hydratase
LPLPTIGSIGVSFLFYLGMGRLIDAPIIAETVHNSRLATVEEKMTYEHILVEREDGVGIVTLNRPDKLNAMNRQLSGELHDAVRQMDADAAIGCIVITGAGDRAFSAGGDIHEQREDDRRYTPQELESRRGRASYEIAAGIKPTIGMINGLAYGGAAVLASSLDMRVGCEDTKFRFLAAAYGRINSTWTLPNQVGWPVAKELLFTARVVEADEAYRIGLLNHLVPRAELRAKTMELARLIAGNHRAAVQGVKALLLQQKGQNLEQQWNKERDYTTHVVSGARAEEAFPEFIARRGRPLG